MQVSFAHDACVCCKVVLDKINSFISRLVFFLRIVKCKAKFAEKVPQVISNC